MTRIRSLALVLGVAALAACSKDGVQTITAPAAGAFVRFYNFGINAPSVNFYANTTKITAINATTCTPPTDPACSSTGLESTTGTAYGSIGNAGFYSEMPAGQYTLAGKISATTDNGLAVASLAATLADGHYYSVYMTGFYDAVNKKSDSFIVEDPLPATIDFLNTAVRFVNASPNSNPMTLYAKNTVTGDSVLVGSNVAFKSASAFVTMPGAAYDLTARYAGSNTGVIVRAGVSFSAGHMYTISARGDMTVVSTTATNRPFLDNTSNR